LLAVDGTPILATRGLGLHIGGARILEDVTLEARRGELVAIIGPNGAGKTSLFNLISGLVEATAGTVELEGRDVTSHSPSRRSRAGLGRTFQISSVFPRLSALENVRLAAEAALGGTLHVWRRADTFRPALERARWALERVGLALKAAWPAGALAHGDQRKLELAMVLAGESKVILLDEPMAGVSAEDVDGLTALIDSVHREEGKTILLVEHRMEVVVGLAERIAVLHHGRLLAFDEPDAVMRDETVQAAYLGEPL
jgi:branched-chain amino acid transport system ATP-binding protein